MSKFKKISIIMLISIFMMLLFQTISNAWSINYNTLNSSSNLYCIAEGMPLQSTLKIKVGANVVDRIYTYSVKHVGKTACYFPENKHLYIDGHDCRTFL